MIGTGRKEQEKACKRPHINCKQHMQRDYEAQQATVGRLSKPEKISMFCTKDLCRFIGMNKSYPGIYAVSIPKETELFRRQLSCFLGIARPWETPIFNSFCKKQETVAFPYTTLYLVGSATAERNMDPGTKREIWYLLSMIAARESIPRRRSV